MKGPGKAARKAARAIPRGGGGTGESARGGRRGSPSAELSVGASGGTNAGDGGGGGGGGESGRSGGGDGGDAERQARRLAQLRAMPQEDLNALVQRITRDRRLPKLRYHLEQHGKLLGVNSEEELQGAFEEHLDRDDLRYFTFTNRRGGTKMWYAVSDGTGRVAQYNEDRREQWSFFAPENYGRFTERGWRRWVEVRKTESGDWRPWKP